MNDSVSVTSAMEKQYDKYDSDVNIEIKKIVDGKNIPYVNMRAINNVSLELESDVVVSSVHSGDSIIGKKKKKTEKATRIKL